MKNFMTLVNDAISEAKVTLDPLTAANFANPPRTILYNKFKSWVNKAYKEVFMMRNEWHFRVERALTTIRPRVLINTGLGPYAPTIGDVLQGTTTGVQFTVLAVWEFEQIEGDVDTTYTVDVEFVDGKRVSDLAVAEVLDLVTPVATPGVATVKAPGFYDFSFVTELLRPDMYSVTVLDTPANPPNTVTGNMSSAQKLVYIPWSNWFNEYALYSINGNKPVYITQTPLGTFDFYPRPDREYLLAFEFARKTHEMVDFDDFPIAMPEEYEDYLIWKAVEEFADYDSNTRLYSRASKNAEKYYTWLERDYMPTMSFGPSKFDRNNRYNR